MGPERHPSALGQRGRECWAEIWHIIGPQIDQVMSGGGATWHENQLVPVTRHGGSQQVYWTYGYSPIDEDDGIGGVLVVCRDVTKDHIAAEALREREAELARVQQIGRIGGLEVDLRTGFRNRRSPEYLLIHGLPPDADQRDRMKTGCGASIPTIAKPPKRNSAMPSQATCATTPCNTGSFARLTARCAGFRFRSTIERDADRQAVRLVGAHSDITEQVEAEQALRQSEERYRTLADQLAELNATLAAARRGKDPRTRPDLERVAGSAAGRRSQRHLANRQSGLDPDAGLERGRIAEPHLAMAGASRRWRHNARAGQKTRPQRDHRQVRKPLSPQGWLLSLAVMDRRVGPGSHLCGGPRRHRGEGRGRPAEGDRRGAAAIAEDGSGGPADRRHRARLQQSADRNRRIAGSAADPAQSGADSTTSRATSTRR